MKLPTSDPGLQPHEGEKRCLNSELWHACAGPLVSLPSVGSRVVYFPQGHSEQVAASTNKEVDAQIPNYPSLPPQLICQLHDVTMHVDAETDEVYAQMTLQPLSPQEQKEPFFPADLGAPSKQPTNYFCKTLTASDTSTHGGFSVPRRAAEKVFPPLDYSQQPPAQELIARDLHDNEWKFRHIFRAFSQRALGMPIEKWAFPRCALDTPTKYTEFYQHAVEISVSNLGDYGSSADGQPKRHLLTTGWSVFVSAKKLVAGDSVLFIWNEKNQLLLGIRRANRPPTVMPSSVLSSDSMHIGLLAAAAHAAATNSRFTIFYNPRASPTEFVIPLAKYIKAVYHTRISIGMRFRMLFETEESSVRRYMGTITGISDLDPVRWPNSHWRSVKVGWDESTAGERQPRVSLWEIEPLTTFPMYPSPFSLRLKRPWLPDLGVPSMNFPVPGITSLMQPRLDSTLLGMQPDVYQAIAAATLQDMRGLDQSRQASSSVLQFQQPQALPSGAIPLLPSQLLQHSQLQTQPQQALLQTVEESQNQTKMQPHLFQPQMQNKKMFNEQQHDQQKLAQQLAQQQQQQLLSTQHQLQQQMAYQQQKQQAVQCLLPQSMSQQHCQEQQQLPSKQQQLPEQLQRYLSNQQVDHTLSTLPQFTSSQSAPVFNQQQNILGSVDNPLATSSLSPLPGIMGSISSEMSAPLVSSTTWLPKRIGVDTVLPSGNPCLPQQVEQFGQHLTSVSQPPVTLAPFLERECSVTQEVDAAEQNNMLFGVHADSSANLSQNGIAKLRNFVSRPDATTMPFASDFTTNAESDFPFSPAIGSSSCLDESGFIRASEHTGQVNPQKETFVKVYKSGSFGRSLDITKFNSYPELRRELGRMFGLEGQLEDPLRSGWQLVFVDQENDILLVGDDPWQEFVNSVGCIKILSPQEVQQMGNSADGLLDSLPSKRLSSSACDEYVCRQNSRNMSNGITSVGSLEY